MKSFLILAILVAFVSVTSFAQDIPSRSPLIEKTTIDKGFGPRLHPVLDVIRAHNGADFDVPIGTRVLTTASGTVSAVGQNNNYGIFVRIRHADGYQTLYAHLSRSLVKKGQSVKSGEAIAESGNSGKSSEPHLHYEVIRNGKNVDPKDYLSAN